MSPRYREEPYTAACPKCGTEHTLSSKPWQSGPRKDLARAECWVYHVGAANTERRIDVYCASCWVEIGAPRTGDTRTCVLCGRVGTGQFRFELHPDTGAPEWRCAHTEKCEERAASR